MIAKIWHSRHVWFTVAMLTAFMAVSWFIAVPAAMAGEPDSDLPYTEPFRVVSWTYLPQSEDWDQEWGADVVLKVTYDDGYAEHDDLFIIDWICFWHLIIEKDALNQFVSAPYGDAGPNHPDGWRRLLQPQNAVPAAP